MPQNNNIEGNTNQRQLLWRKLNWKSRDFLTRNQKDLF